MAGFLDKETRIIDMVLTGYGKDLLSKGELRFAYWVPFDNEVDYDPPIMNSASLSSVALTASKFDQVEATLVEEAKTGYRRLNNSGSDTTNVYGPMFMMAHGQRVIPRMTASDGPTGSIELEVKQQKFSDLHVKKDQFGNTIEQLGPFDRVISRFDASNFTFGYKYAAGSFPSDYQPEGFLVRIYRSGTEGLQEVFERRDEENHVAFNNDLRFMPGKIAPIFRSEKKRGG